MCLLILITASLIDVKMAEVALTWSMDTAVCVLQDTQALIAKQVILTVNNQCKKIIDSNYSCKYETIIHILKTIHFANICSQILTTASPIGVKMAEVALNWLMDTAVCVKLDTQALTAKQVRPTVIDHSSIHSFTVCD